MLVRLTERDQVEVLEFLTREADLNLFLLSDLETFGLRHPYLRLWGQRTDGMLTAVLLHYRTSAAMYVAREAEYDPALFIDKLRQLPDWEFFSGETNRIEPVLKALSVNSIRRFEYAHILPERFSPSKPQPTFPVVRLQSGHAGLYRDLRMQIDEFSDIAPSSVENTKAYIRSGWWRVYGVMHANELVSAATVTVHARHASMITAVMTREGFRGYGLASQVLMRICQDMFRQGKRLCLFYDNPDAGKIYQRLGFTNIAQWSRAKR